MLAALGFIIGEQLEDFPAFFNFDGSITGPAIFHFQQPRGDVSRPSTGPAISHFQQVRGAC
eukprot:848798-Prorocentrum_minimum.AAC.1